MIRSALKQIQQQTRRASQYIRRHQPHHLLSIYRPLTNIGIIHRSFSQSAENSPSSTSQDNSSSSEATISEDASSADDFVSPSTARTFRNYVRSRSGHLAARADREVAHLAAGGKREWRDSIHMRSLKEEARGGVIRKTRVKIQDGRMEEFIAWAEQNLQQAYTHEGFKGALLTVNDEEHTVENLTFWTSTHSLDANNISPIYGAIMSQLAEFIVDVPTIEMQYPTVEIKGKTK